MRRRAVLASGAAALIAFGAAACTRGANADGVVLLTDTGEEVRWDSLKGRPRAVFFGFTHCPVICPVTVWELNDAIDKIGGPDIAIEFVTVDPERDTPARLHEYLSGFGERVHGFTGTPEAIARVARAFDVTYRKTPLERGDYTMDHTPTVFLLDAAGRQADVVAYGSPPEVMQARLRALTAGAPAP